MEMVPNSNFAHRACSSQVYMLCVIDKYRLFEFHLNALAGQKGEFCDLVTLSHLYKIHPTGWPRYTHARDPGMSVDAT